MLAAIDPYTIPPLANPAAAKTAGTVAATDPTTKEAFYTPARSYWIYFIKKYFII
jgi:hypothetical protein